MASPGDGVSLFLVGGASGAGKSTVRTLLRDVVAAAVLFESDVLWRAEYEDDGRTFVRLWLRLAADVARPDRPVVIFGGGFAMPENIEPLPERAAFARVHYLALVCDDAELAARIRRRSAPRRTDEAHIAEQAAFNRWLRAHGATTTPPIALVDTTRIDADEAAARVAAWIRDPPPPA